MASLAIYSLAQPHNRKTKSVVLPGQISGNFSVTGKSPPTSFSDFSPTPIPKKKGQLTASSNTTWKGNTLQKVFSSIQSLSGYMGLKAFLRCPRHGKENVLTRGSSHLPPPPPAESRGSRQGLKHFISKSNAHSLPWALSASPDGHSNSVSKLKQTENLLPGCEALLPPAKFLPSTEEFLGQLSACHHENRVSTERVTGRQ